MLNNYVEILRTVRNLAEIRHREEVCNSKEDNPEGKPLIEIADINDHEDTSGLLPCLLAQDMQTIKVIQTVMLIGRDFIPESEEENYKRTLWNSENPEQIRPAPRLQSEKPQVLFNEWLAYNSGISDWQDRKIEIDYIYSKSPLHEYLKRAFLILSLDK